MFINRQKELDLLTAMYRSNRAELFVLYGRRRVGKTELLRAFSEGRPHLFFIATLSADSEQLAVFSRQVWLFTHAETPAGFSFPTWDAAFQALADLPGRPIVVLDEFTYLISGNKAIPSILQKVWDERLKSTSIMLILCGSYIGMMETEVLSYQAPLYGRRTNSVLLEPMENSWRGQWQAGCPTTYGYSVIKRRSSKTFATISWIRFRASYSMNRASCSWRNYANRVITFRF
jgi:AAA+ ATPase superfamily predicted ATPase